MGSLNIVAKGFTEDVALERVELCQEIMFSFMKKMVALCIRV